MPPLSPKAVLSAIELHLDSSSSAALARAVTFAIRDGAVEPGELLPPIRIVALQLGLSPTTVSAAWRLLRRAGSITTDGRRGTAIADPITTGSRRYERAVGGGSQFRLDLSTGVPDPTLLPDPSAALGRVSAAAATGSYLDDPNVPELIAVLRESWPYDPTDMIMVDGAMDGIELATRAVVQFGDRVIVEQPTFPPILDLLEVSGARILGVPLDDQGMDPDALHAALAGGPVAALYLQPRAQNPTGVSMTGARSRQIADLLRTTTTVVIEDDSAGSVAASTPISLGSWNPESTLHIRSFSKSHGPDLRLAALSGPEDLIGRISALRRLGQGWTSRLLQHLLLAMLTEENAIRVVEHAKTTYSARRHALVDALAHENIAVPGTDGLNIWLPVKNESAAVLRLAGQGIGVTPGSPFSVLPDVQAHVRVNCGLVDTDCAELSSLLATASRGSVHLSA